MKNESNSGAITEAIEKLLASITLTIGDDGLRYSFTYSSPNGCPGTRFAETIFCHPVERDMAALHVRQVGPAYLRSLPLDTICSKLWGFMKENYWLIANTTFLQRNNDKPLNSWIPEKEKSELAEALAKSSIFNPVNELTVFPLVPVVVENNFKSDLFFFSSPKDDDAFFLGDEKKQLKCNPGKFPPLDDGQRKTSKPTSWLGVYSPDYQASLKTRTIILGALALTCNAQNRYMFSLRQVFGGSCTLTPKRGITLSFEKIHTPPCANNISITDADTDWMKLLSDKLPSTDKEVVRELKALEYYYRSWPLLPHERFPNLCMALDAVFGNVSHATKAVVEGVMNTLDEEIQEQQRTQIEHLVKLRASVIHGGAPDVYESSKYQKYYKRYRCDPIRDLELIVTECLRKKVFQGKLGDHQDPDESTIQEFQARGRLPPNIQPISIFNPLQ